MSEKYLCIGSVRGWCGHRHRTVAAADRCCREDDRRCHIVGGYSDRCIYRESDVSHTVDGYPYIPVGYYIPTVDPDD